MIVLWIALGCLAYVGVWILTSAVLDVIEPPNPRDYLPDVHAAVAMFWPVLIPALLFCAALDAAGRASAALALRIVAWRNPRAPRGADGRGSAR